MSNSKSNIAFFVTGSIAAFKGVSLLSLLLKAGHSVRVVASANALKFIGAATWEGLSGHPVIHDTFTEGEQMAHIHLCRWAHLGIVYPASANLINQLAQGLAPDLVTTSLLAWDFSKPLWLAPAMNSAMYKHPATQRALASLHNFGYQLLPVGEGGLACGDTGPGRVMEPEAAYERIFPALTATRRRVLVSAGGTEEPIDGVRTLSNLSSGRTGAQIARALAQAGHEVTLLAGRRSQTAGPQVRHLEFSDYASLASLLERELSENFYDWLIHAAAVSDYSVYEIQIDDHRLGANNQVKLSSQAEKMTLHLRRNPKLLPQLKTFSANPNLRVVGFKLTQNAHPDEQRDAVRKLFASGGVDYVLHNDLAGIDVAQGRHEATLCTPQGSTKTTEHGHEISQMLVELVASPSPAQWAQTSARTTAEKTLLVEQRTSL